MSEHGTDQQRALSPNERKAREIVMCHDARCHGDIFPDKPYCSTLAFNEPLCPSCQTLQDAIAHALAEQAAIDAARIAELGQAARDSQQMGMQAIDELSSARVRIETLEQALRVILVTLSEFQQPFNQRVDLAWRQADTALTGAQ